MPNRRTVKSIAAAHHAAAVSRMRISTPEARRANTAAARAAMDARWEAIADPGGNLRPEVRSERVRLARSAWGHYLVYCRVTKRKPLLLGAWTAKYVRWDAS